MIWSYNGLQFSENEEHVNMNKSHNVEQQQKQVIAEHLQFEVVYIISKKKKNSAIYS